jgi:hypothetical protein
MQLATLPGACSVKPEKAGMLHYIIVSFAHTFTTKASIRLALMKCVAHFKDYMHV